jgi:hypothetical protein
MASSTLRRMYPGGVSHATRILVRTKEIADPLMIGDLAVARLAAKLLLRVLEPARERRPAGIVILPTREAGDELLRR